MSSGGQDSQIWVQVATTLRSWAVHDRLFRYGQADSLRWIADRVERGGFILADEVGLGKTRLSLLVMVAALEAGANVVAVVPAGLLLQWRREAMDLQRELDEVFPGSLGKWTPTLVRSYDHLFDLSPKEKYPLADHRQQRWVLISQSFDLYRSKRNANVKGLELPAFVRAAWEGKDAHGNNRWVHYAAERARTGGEFVAAERRAARFLSSLKFASEWTTIFAAEELRPFGRGGRQSNADCSAFFQSGRDGRKLLMHLVGRLIGRVDLLVMDEAHKSREEGDEPEKRLGRLLQEVLQTAPDARRISMTATPVELGARQWASLLRRTGIGPDHPNWPEIDLAITGFASALASANDRADQPEALELLISAAGRFEAALRPFVTRRRRIEQDEMKALVPQALTGAHPHRELTTHVIEVEQLDDDWRRFVLAAEGRGLAGEGQANIRYASGLATARPPAGREGPASHRRGTRAAAWRGLQERLEGASVSRLWAHPRVVGAADRIEELLQFDGNSPTEKVLVFGTYTEPMEALRDVLNGRQLLRALDLDVVAAVPKAPDLALLRTVYAEGRRGQRFSGCLVDPELDEAGLATMIGSAHARYERAREAVLARIHGESAWVAAQPGDHALRALRADSPQAYSFVFETLRAEVFDVLLYCGEDAATASGERLDSLAHEAWKEHLICMLHGDENLDDEPASGSHTANIVGNSKLERLDAQADRLAPKRIIDYFEKEPRSQFCRLLDGGVAAKTRQAIQASFNRREVGPYVLVAQSMVGREGLNLHRACRKVFLFHPEWNPGVMEQQIGRVDRIESLWTKLAAAWNGALPPGGEVDLASFPRIAVESLVFRGTYDEFQSGVLQSRRAALNAQLFGALLEEEALERVPAEFRARIARGAPDFGPGRR